MLPRADIITLAPLDPVAPLAPLNNIGDARQQALQRVLAGQLGKSMQGEVLSKLNDGSFIVKVGGASARMLLPAGIEVGADIPLTLVSINPRPTFQISSSAGGQLFHAYAEAGPALLPGPLDTAARAGPLVYLDGQSAQDAAGLAPAVRAPLSHAAALLGKAPLTPAELLPALDPDNSSASLSNTGRLIGAVLGAALKAEHAPSAIIASAALLGKPGVAPQQMAAALRDAIGHSGLFYESHVADWAGGKRTLAELALEPQMQAAREADRTDGARPSPRPTDPATAQFINLQLSTQEQARVAWQGQLWPGQPMEWEINKDAPEQEGSEHVPVWRSGLRLRFARLGELAATLVLHGDRLQVRIETSDGAVRQLLRDRAGGLAGALEAAGTPLSSLAIGPGQVADE